MEETLSNLLRGGLSVETEADSLLEINPETAAYGLTLSWEEARGLARTHRAALENCGRVEIGSGTVEKIALAFSRSRYLNRKNYADVVGEAAEAFYELKNESDDMVSDDELIALLADGFERYGGELEPFLNSRELDRLLRTRRFGEDYTEKEKPDDDEKEEGPDE